MLNKALDIAYKAHLGQTDKAGAPYILHPIRAALRQQTENEKIVALLHDVVKDTLMTLEELKAEGFSDEVLAALKCLTQIEGEDYPKMETDKKALDCLEQRSNKKILYVDMDNVLVNFQSGIDALSEDLRNQYVGRYDEVPNIFSKMQPNERAIDAINCLKDKYDIYILSTSPWDNPSAWSDKLEWVKRYLGEVCYKRLILSHHKDLNAGDYLIDDRKKNGAADFKGRLILFGSEQFPDWKSVVEYLL